MRTIEMASAPPVIGARPYQAMPIKAPPVVSGSPQCPACHAAVEAGDNFCIMCGTTLVNKLRQCPSCSGYPSPDDRFCVFCGTTLPQVVGG
jgi:predicted amidophosphoribosyltransferase